MFVAFTCVGFALHLWISFTVSMWSYSDEHSHIARFLWCVFRFPENLPDLLPDEYGTLLRPYWLRELSGTTLAANSLLWGLAIAAIIMKLVRRRPPRASSTEAMHDCPIKGVSRT
jgi:hypothetical protein